MKDFIGIFYLFYTESNVNKKSLLLKVSFDVIYKKGKK